MEEAKLPTVEPKGESVMKSFGFENRESFVVKQKATNEELAEHDSISLIGISIGESMITPFLPTSQMRHAEHKPSLVSMS